MEELKPANAIQINKERENNEACSQTEYNEYPDIPLINEKKQSITKSIYSVIIFAVAYYFLFGWDIISIAILTGVILIHELGHYGAMRAFNYKNLDIFFIPLLGAYTSGQKDEVSQKQEILVLLAGPLPGIIIGPVLVYYGMVTEHNIYYKSGSIFLFLNLFNLLPVLPMDGGRVIQTLFFKQKEYITVILLWMSILLFAGYGVYSENWILLLICLMIFMQIKILNQNIKVKKILKEEGYNINKSFTELTNKEYWKIRSIMASNMRVIGNFTNPDNFSEVPEEATIVKAMKNIIQSPPVNSLGLGGKVFYFSLWLLSFIIPVIIMVVMVILNGPILKNQ